MVVSDLGSVKLWYITDSYKIIRVDAFPRQDNYYWVPSQGYSACMGHHLFEYRSQAVERASAVLRDLISNYQIQLEALV